MTTQAGANTHVIAIDGNFDDAQTNVKRMFNDVDLREKLLTHHMQFSSANSMNIGRLVPQVVYYVYAYAQLVKAGHIKNGDKVNFTVPTGNFGNILAAYYAGQIGVPVGKIICASNENNVLTDFFATGTYDKKRDFKVTTSPSMDILVSSNLERLIFHLLGNDAVKTKELMDALVTKGEYTLADADKGILDLFAADLQLRMKQLLKSNVFMKKTSILKILTQRLLQLFTKHTFKRQMITHQQLSLQQLVHTSSHV